MKKKKKNHYGKKCDHTLFRKKIILLDNVGMQKRNYYA